MMKLDIQKAYDSLDWKFLKQVMHGLKFPEQFISWISTCLSIVRLSFLINGQSYGFIQAKRGLRQGDPISPLLFLLGMKYLSRSLQSLNGDPDFHYHTKCRNLKLTHMCFADDFMGFCRADRTSPIILKKKIEEFAQCSGLIVNPQKSQVFLSFEGQVH